MILKTFNPSKLILAETYLHMSLSNPNCYSWCLGGGWRYDLLDLFTSSVTVRSIYCSGGNLNLLRNLKDCSLRKIVVFTKQKRTPYVLMSVHLSVTYYQYLNNWTIFLLIRYERLSLIITGKFHFLVKIAIR